MRKRYFHTAAAVTAAAVLCLTLAACGQKDSNKIGQTASGSRTAADQGTEQEPDTEAGQGTETGGGTETAGAADTRPDQAEPSRPGEGGFEAPRIGVQEYPRVDGSTATIPLSQGLYQLVTGATAEEAQLAVNHTKTTGSYMELLQGRTDLVIAYAPGPMVQEEITSSGVNIRLEPVGRDALVFMANASNQVNSLTQQQVVDIYSGKITNWSQVGGADLKIEAFQRPENSGSQNLMSSLVMKDVPMASAPQEYVPGEMGELIEAVANYSNTGSALGYSVYFYARNMYQVPDLKFMALDQVLPAKETIKDGSYPYVNDFYVAVRENEPKDSRAYELFTWLTSDNGQALVEELGYVGVSATSKKLPAGWNGGENTPGLTASLDLPPGTCILADGEHLFGMSGLAVLDSHMKLQYYINSVSSDQVDYMIQSPQDALLVLNDLRENLCGLYDLEQRDWVIPPAYDNIFPQEDGYIMISYSDGEGSSGLWGKCDLQGNVIEQRELRDDDPWNIYDIYDYGGASDFAKNHPEILKKYGVTEEAVNVRSSEEAPSYVVISEGALDHYYRSDGSWILDVDTAGLWETDGYYGYMNEVSDSLAYVEQFTDDGQVICIYKDGAMIKRVSCTEDEYLSDVGENFYTKFAGNYIWVYNYRDEPVARYLQGWLADD